MAFRPRLSAGLALSLQLLSIVVAAAKYSKKSLDCPIVNRIGIYMGSGNVRFGSLAVIQRPITPMAAFERIADTRQRDFESLRLYVRFHQ